MYSLYLSFYLVFIIKKKSDDLTFLLRVTVTSGIVYGFYLRCLTGPFPVSPVPVLAGEVAHRYRL